MPPGSRSPPSRTRCCTEDLPAGGAHPVLGVTHGLGRSYAQISEPLPDPMGLDTRHAAVHDDAIQQSPPASALGLQIDTQAKGYLVDSRKDGVGGGTPKGINHPPKDDCHDHL